MGQGLICLDGYQGRQNPCLFIMIGVASYLHDHFAGK
jgi:hypothetical protein